MKDYLKKGMSSFNEPEESMADILYPTMRNIKPKTSSFSDAFSGNSFSEKKKSGTLLGESIYDDDDDFKDLKFDFKVDSDKPKDDWISKQIAKEDEEKRKFKETADILYGKTTPEHGPNWIGNRNVMSQKDDNLDDFDNSLAKNSDDDEDDILDLLYPSMRNIGKKTGLKKDLSSGREKTSGSSKDNIYINNENNTSKYYGRIEKNDINKTDKPVVINGVKYPEYSEDYEINDIKTKGENELKEIEKERWKEHGKNAIGAAAIIGSSFVPGFKEAKVTTALGKALMPKVGKVIGEKIAQNAVKNTVSGAVAGAGSSVINDENPVKGAAEGATFGAIGGAAGGAIIGKAENTTRIKNLSSIHEKKKDWGIAYRAGSGSPEKAIEILLEKKNGFVPGAIKKDGIGDIDFIWGKGGKNGYGLAHIIENRNDQGFDGVEYVKKLPGLIKSGEVKTYPEHPGRKYIVHENTKTAIRLDWSKKERKWLVTSYYILEE